eukprot:TRINITY_DN26964_c0_g1_i1.p1 TRINITY_DN26964_c0_g1~~TRINITY_DN26964_c0_g1_i1.p1  ORF type:complete len:401 (-),score=6.92 TRINITY_DN26964_c0_g1_i1:138-1340(-)
MSLLLRVPFDAIQLVADFLNSVALACCCTTMWEVLKFHTVTVPKFNQEDLGVIGDMIQAGVRSLRVKQRIVDCQVLDKLRNAHHLHTLHFCIDGAKVGGESIREFVAHATTDLRNLQYLSLDFSWTDMCECDWLEPLRRSPSPFRPALHLSSLTVDLSYAVMTQDDVTVWTAGISNLAHLKTLNLKFNSNKHISADGMMRKVTKHLGALLLLDSLQLELTECKLSDKHIHILVSGLPSSVRHLRLHLARNCCRNLDWALQAALQLHLDSAWVSLLGNYDCEWSDQDFQNLCGSVKQLEIVEPDGCILPLPTYPEEPGVVLPEPEVEPAVPPLVIPASETTVAFRAVVNEIKGTTKLAQVGTQLCQRVKGAIEKFEHKTGMPHPVKGWLQKRGVGLTRERL